MAINPLLQSAESWEKVYQAFDKINFVAYDFNAVKQSLIDYLKFYYPENFNDYIESSSMIAIISAFAYTVELLAYRVDLSVHETTIATADRKQSILRQAKLVSYTATRNLPLRGLAKITSVTISEDVRDSQGTTLANRVIKWNDPSNSLWKEQFFITLNKVLTYPFGNPLKSFQLDDTVFQQYELKNLLETESSKSTFKNGVLKNKVKINGQSVDFEMVPADIDVDGIFERDPNFDAYFNVLYADDGFGDGSDTTGFMFFMKQGSLSRLNYVFDTPQPNKILEIALNNINDVDVWVQKIDESGKITESWDKVANIQAENLIFNSIKSTKKYEVETLENDQIRLIFGDGDFGGEIPTGIFNIWARQSTSGELSVSKSAVINETVTFIYISKQGSQESCTLTYSLTSALQNSAPTEDIEHIRASAPSVYFSQNRMVNGEDYNSFPLKDPSILRLKSINRTFAGQPKHLAWNDASGVYQNIKLFGNDLRMYRDTTSKGEINTTSPRNLIDEIIEPMLSHPGMYNLITYVFNQAGSPLNLAFIRPRTKFLENVDQVIGLITVQEKTEIQGVLDRHWYGEPDEIVLLDSSLTTAGTPKTVYAVVNKDTDERIYDANMKMVTKDTTTGVYTVVNTPGNISGIQEASARQTKFGIKLVPDRPFSSALRINSVGTTPIPNSDFLSSLDIDQPTAKAETYTVEITGTDGTFAVHGSLSGEQAGGVINEDYDNGIISFKIGFPPAVSTAIVIGDAFIINVVFSAGTYTPVLYKKNLTGRFEIIEEALISGAESLPFNSTDSIASWFIIIERVDNSNGQFDYWKITRRDFSVIIESPTTNFWVNNEVLLIDPDTRKQVRDVVRLLQSNLNAARTQAIGADAVYDVITDVKYSDGTTNPHALAVTPKDLTLEFLSFITNSDYIYFYKNPASGRLAPLPATAYLQALTYIDNVSGNYVRKQGRSDLYFMWQHFTPRENLIDPSTSNIHDMYILTRGYYSAVIRYLRGIDINAPTPPSSLELRSTYRKTLEKKMLSDTVVMHSGQIKLLFGSLAIPELRASIKIVGDPAAKLSADQIRVRVLQLIDNYFQIANWDFGKEFFATQMITVIQQKLAGEVSSVVLVPRFPLNYFGDLFHLRSNPDEIFLSCATLDDIEVVSNLDRLTLKQKL